jgi:hypothetical protein
MGAAYRLDLIIVLILFCGSVIMAADESNQSPNPYKCVQVLSVLGDPSIRDPFGYSRIKADVIDGKLYFPRSKAYYFWRNRTPPHIPDSAFAFPSLSDAQIVQYAAERSKIESQRRAEFEWEQQLIRIKPEELVARGDALVRYLTRRAKVEEALGPFPKRIIIEPSTVQFLVVEIDGKIEIFYGNFVHNHLEQIVKDNYPQAKTLIPGRVNLKGTFNDDGSVRIDLVSAHVISFAIKNWGPEHFPDLIAELKSRFNIVPETEIKLTLPEASTSSE